MVIRAIQVVQNIITLMKMDNANLVIQNVLFAFQVQQTVWLVGMIFTCTITNVMKVAQMVHMQSAKIALIVMRNVQCAKMKQLIVLVVNKNINYIIIIVILPAQMVHICNQLIRQNALNVTTVVSHARQNQLNAHHVKVVCFIMIINVIQVVRMELIKSIQPHVQNVMINAPNVLIHQHIVNNAKQDFIYIIMNAIICVLKELYKMKKNKNVSNAMKNANHARLKLIAVILVMNQVIFMIINVIQAVQLAHIYNLQIQQNALNVMIVA